MGELRKMQVLEPKSKGNQQPSYLRLVLAIPIQHGHGKMAAVWA